MDSFRSQWRENLDLEMNWQVITFEESIDKRAYKPHLSIRTWGAEYPDPDDFLRKNAFWIYTGWQNKFYERLVEQARVTVDQEKRLRLYRQADRILIEEAVILPLSYLRSHYLVKPWVKRFPTSPIRFHFYKDVIIEPH